MTELQSLIEAHFIQRQKDEEELIALVNRIVSALYFNAFAVLCLQGKSEYKNGAICFFNFYLVVPRGSRLTDIYVTPRDNVITLMRKTTLFKGLHKHGF